MKTRDALEVGANLAAVVTFVIGVGVLIWSAVNDKLVLGLSVALAASVVLNTILLATRRLKPPNPPSPVAAALAAMANPGQKYRVPPMERNTASLVLQYMNEAMDRFEYDNAHGLDEAGDAARAAARIAKTTAEGISDQTVRDTVALFEEAVAHSPGGWKEGDGANLAQMDRLRDAHTIAVKMVGALLRPVE